MYVFFMYFIKDQMFDTFKQHYFAVIIYDVIFK